MVIILNGTSSSGKSSLVGAIQEQSTRMFLEYGLDKFIFMLPKRYLNTKLWNEVMGDADKAGNVGHQLIQWMHKSASILAQNGANLIMDHVLIEDNWKKELSALFSGSNTYLIKVFCPLDILEKRESNRKDRTLGQARKQYSIVHEGLDYDFEIDTSIETIESGATKIINYTNENISKGLFIKK